MGIITGDFIGNEQGCNPACFTLKQMPLSSMGLAPKYRSYAKDSEKRSSCNVLSVHTGSCGLQSFQCGLLCNSSVEGHV